MTSFEASRDAAELIVARGRRLPWSALAPQVLAALEAELGDRVVEATTIELGFSPAIAATVTTAGGRRYFVKAACSQPDAIAPQFHRREIAIASALPPDVPAPRLLWSFDEGAPGWVLLLFEHVDGHVPSLPWSDADVAAVGRALDELAEVLTPSPIDASLVRSVADSPIVGGGHFAELDATAVGAELAPWLERHRDRLVGLEPAAPAGVGGTTLVHFDVRSDNLLVTADRVVFVDWPHALVGAPWIDAVAFAPSLEVQGGPDPETFLRGLAVGAAADPDAVTAAVAGLVGFFLSHAAQPDNPALPGLRRFQRVQGEAALRWLVQRTGWH